MQRGKARRLKSKDTYTPLLHGNAIRSALSTAIAVVADGRVTKSFQRKSGPDARNGGRSSHAGAMRMGPSARYRRIGTVRSSVRSPHIVGSQRSVPRRHHCQPAPRFCSEMTVSKDGSGAPLLPFPRLVPSNTFRRRLRGALPRSRARGRRAQTRQHTPPAPAEQPRSHAQAPAKDDLQRPHTVTGTHGPGASSLRARRAGQRRIPGRN